MPEPSTRFTPHLPFVVENFSSPGYLSLLETAANQKEFFGEKLLAHGALLLRGFELENVGEFENFVRFFSGKSLFGYAGGVSPRNSLSSGGVYSSTEYPPEAGLSLHNELSYSDVYPEKLYFSCLVAPERGGETTLGDSRRILRRIDRQIVESFKTRKICYIRNLTADKHSEYSWQSAFETEEKQEVEKICRKIGADFEWKPNDLLQIRQIRPATATHPITGEEVWFNQADGFHPSNLGLENYEAMDENEFRLNCTFGDGAAFEASTLEHVRDVLRGETVRHRWRKGDILILDNLLAAHGRMPFSGSRKIILAMT